LLTFCKNFEGLTIITKVFHFIKLFKIYINFSIAKVQEDGNKARGPPRPFFHNSLVVKKKLP
jgi:hypothetical protein